MRTAKIIIVLIGAVIAYILLTNQMYEFSEVDTLVKKVHESNGGIDEIEELLDYSTWHGVDAGSYIHYHANLYDISRKYHENFKKFSKSHSKLYSKVVEEGQSYYDDWFNQIQKNSS